MAFSFKPADRKNVSCLIALAGSTGSGKTYSALRLATGLAPTGKIAFIDTEAGRGLHYADRFKFDHGELKAPFRPDCYREAIEAADQAGYEVIVIDSFSHVWSGDGGILDWHDSELDLLVDKARKNAASKGWNFDENKTREAFKMTAWIEPKMSNKRMMSRLLQVRAHVIFCLRAEEKMLMTSETMDNGRKKTVIVPASDRPVNERWQPICEKSFMYEQMASFVLTSDNPGVGIPIKLQEQHKAIFPDGVRIDEDTGKRLREWACGAEPVDDTAALKAQGREVAAQGGQALDGWLKSLSAADKKKLSAFGAEIREIANKVDQEVK